MHVTRWGLGLLLVACAHRPLDPPPAAATVDVAPTERATAERVTIGLLLVRTPKDDTEASRDATLRVDVRKGDIADDRCYPNG